MPARITEVAVDRARRQLARDKSPFALLFLSFCVDHTLTDTLNPVGAAAWFFLSHEVVAACLDGAATRSIFFFFFSLSPMLFPPFSLILLYHIL
jgi:hypothetical protein